jgi:hypothetical protein
MAAERPLLMVGVEVRRYGLEERVAELARRLRIPVVTSFMGRGLLAHAQVPLAGTYLGLAGDPQVSAQVERSDALLLLGVIVSDTNFAVSARRMDTAPGDPCLRRRRGHGPPCLPPVAHRGAGGRTCWSACPCPACRGGGARRRRPPPPARVRATRPSRRRTSPRPSTPVQPARRHAAGQ